MTLTELVARAEAQAIALGWRDPPPSHVEALALIHSEVSEVLEELRRPAVRMVATENGKPVGVASELADVVIRVAELCGAMGVDLAAAVETKLAFNATREWRHGGKRL